MCFANPNLYVLRQSIRSCKVTSPVSSPEQDNKHCMYVQHRMLRNNRSYLFRLWIDQKTIEQNKHLFRVVAPLALAPWTLRKPILCGHLNWFAWRRCVWRSGSKASFGRRPSRLFRLAFYVDDSDQRNVVMVFKSSDQRNVMTDLKRLLGRQTNL